MRRNVESSPNSAPVDAHERSRDYLSEEEFGVHLQGTLLSRHRWRNAARASRSWGSGCLTLLF
jgi:hypothetical protein